MNVSPAHRRLAPAAWLLLAMAAGSAAAGPTSSGETRAAPVVAVLCYHDFSDDPTAPGYTLPPDTLRAHIRRAKALGWQFLSLSDVRARAARPASLPAKTIVLTFDDGYRSFAEKALPILRSESVRATLCVVSGWVDHPPPGLPPLLGWAEIRQLERTGLVEIAAHTHDLHHYVPCDPAGDTAPATTARRYLAEAARYESRDEYRTRIVADLDSARSRLRAELGHDVHALAWPYGEWNETARLAASAAGFDVTLGLEGEDAPLDSIRNGYLPRTMVYRDTKVGAADLAWLHPARREAAAAFVSLDDLFAPDAVTLTGRVDVLAARLLAAGVRRVVLSTCSDPVGDGFLDRAWFQNHQVGVRADAWARVAYRLRAMGLAVWAKAPALNLTWAWIAHPEWRIPAPVEPLGAHAAPAYFRLRPDSEGARGAARDFFTDLAVYLPVSGIVFDDDGYLGPGEGASAGSRRDAVRSYVEIAKEAVRRWRPACRFGRLLHASVLDREGPCPGFAQDLEESLGRDDWTVIEAYPPAAAESSATAAWSQQLARVGVARRQRLIASSPPGTPIAPLCFAFPAAAVPGPAGSTPEPLAAWVAGARRAGATGFALLRPSAGEGSLPPGLFDALPIPSIP